MTKLDEDNISPLMEAICSCHLLKDLTLNFSDNPMQ